MTPPLSDWRCAHCTSPEICNDLKDCCERTPHETGQQRPAKATRALSDTPRTDALQKEFPFNAGANYIFDHARQLEREWVGMKSEVNVCHEKLARLERELASLRDDAAREVEKWKRLYECAQNANSYRQQALGE